MRPAILVLCLILLAVPSSAEPSGRLLDPAEGIALTYPQGWRVVEATGFLARLWPPDQSAVYQVREVDATGTAAEMEERLARKALSDGRRVIRRWRTRVGDQPASGMLTTSSRSVERTTVVRFGARAFLLQGVAPTQKAYDRWAATFDRMDASFRARERPDDGARSTTSERDEALQRERERRQQLQR